MAHVDRRTLLRAALTSLAAGGAATLLPGAPPAAAAGRTRVIGRSVQGRPLVLTTLGDPAAGRRLLVVGCIHGSEPAGVTIVDRLARSRPPAGTALLLVRSVNPDGQLRGTRQNARGVDLNRNFPTRWAGGGAPGEVYYPGPRAGSEPETQAVLRLVAAEQPDVTIWYHQHLDLVDLSGGDAAISRRYARRSGLRAEQLTRFGGSVATWQNTVHRGTTAVVVELPARVDGPMQVRHVAAVLAAAADL